MPPGESHFNAHQQPYLYFQVLLLTVQFEAVSMCVCMCVALSPGLPCQTPAKKISVGRAGYESGVCLLCVCLSVCLVCEFSRAPDPISSQAIEFLSRQELLHTHAVHFAIALQDMELLHLTDSTQTKLCKPITYYLSLIPKFYITNLIPH